MKHLTTIVLAVLVLAVFRQAGAFSFITLDDDLYVTGNPAVRAGLNVVRSTSVASWALIWAMRSSR